MINKQIFLNLKFCRKGSTLLEIVVAVGIFSVAILIATSIFQSVAEGQRSAIVAQNIQEDVRYAMEIMGREIRMARASNGDCEDYFQAKSTNRIFNVNADKNKLYFKNEKDNCVMYSIDNNRLIKTVIDTTVIPNVNLSIFLTSAKIKIKALKFSIIDNQGAISTVQPMVTMMFDIEYIGKKMHKQQMKIQTTISSRYYE